MYRRRIVSWMGLWTRGQCVVDADLSSLYLVVLPPGTMIPLHGAFNFAVNDVEHEHHDLISILSIQPEAAFAKNEADDGLWIYDPRGTASGYGFANTLIRTSQSEQLNSRGGYLHIFPSALKFSTLPVDYTRVLVVSFAKTHSVHQPYRRRHAADSRDSASTPGADIDGAPSGSATTAAAAAAGPSIPVFHFQADGASTYLPKNDEPFFDQNIQFFSSFGTPIYRSSVAEYKSVSVPAVSMEPATFEALSECVLEFASRTPSVRKSNRNGWQSAADIFGGYRAAQWMERAEGTECVAAIGVLYEFVVEQVALWLLSLSNSYYFDDNGLIINIEAVARNQVFVDVVDSWFGVNSGIAMNVPHSHPNSDLSGIIYIEVPPNVASADTVDGNLFFEDPRGGLFDNDQHLPFAQFNEPLQITPKVGDTVIFPSWLRHWTAPSFTARSEPRIAFAFNVRFRTRKQSKHDIQSRAKERKHRESKGDFIQILKKEL